MATLLNLTRNFSQTGLSRSGFTFMKLIADEEGRTSKKLISRTAIVLAMCGISMSLFCTRQLSEKPATCSLVGRQK
ncbi:Hypothetical predicted protein [Mytilus galloprovincialis]|nr:Hypothetical predicted protein [Mytilus galloprovincialis]